MERSVSPYNENLAPSGPLVLCDVTLREGEQTAGVSFSQEERMGLVQRLDKAGIQQVQLYNTWHGDQPDEKALEINAGLCALPRRQIKTEVLNFNTSDLPRLKQMIDLQAETHPDVIHASFSLKAAGENELCERERKIQETAEYIAGKNIECNISLLDSTRSDPQILQRMMGAAARSGAARVRLADTVGVASPGGIQNMCQLACQAAGFHPVILGIHTHNDFGLGLADALAGIRGGATLIDGSVNGLGERCGNASLIEIIVALESLYGIPTGVQLSKLLELSRYVAEISGIPVPSNAPFVGKYAFSDSLAAHIALSLQDPFAVEGIRPETFGGRRIAFLSKNITEEVLQLLAGKQHISLSKEELPRLYAKICQLSAPGTGTVLTEDDLPRLAAAIKENK